MSPPHRSDLRARAEWKSRPVRSSAFFQTAVRVAVAALGLALLAAFAGLMLLHLRQHRPLDLRLILLPIVEYPRQPQLTIPYAHHDAAAWDTLDAKVDDWRRRANRDRLNSLSQDLAGLAEDVLFFYAVAHVAVDGQTGEPFLACTHFSPHFQDEKISLKELVSAIGSCPIHHKVLVIDVGNWKYDACQGRFINLFPRLLQDLVESFRPERGELWVLASNRVHEESHVSHGDRRSVFSFFVEQGLRGAARADPPVGTVDLFAFYQYVAEQVSRFVWNASEGRCTQTPFLMKAGEGWVSPSDHDGRLAAAARRVVVGPLAGRSRQQTTDQEAPSDEDAASSDPSPKNGWGEELLEQHPQWHDEWIGDELDWDAIDYAPALWGVLDQQLRTDLELVFRRFPMPPDDSALSLSLPDPIGLQNHRAAWNSNVARNSYQQLDELRKAIRVRNRALFELPEYVQLSTFADRALELDLQSMMEKTGELHSRLLEEEWPEEGWDSQAEAARQLEALSRELQDLRQNVRLTLKLDAPAPLPADPLWRDALLQTGLITPERRQQLYADRAEQPALLKAASRQPARSPTNENVAFLRQRAFQSIHRRIVLLSQLTQMLPAEFDSQLVREELAQNLTALEQAEPGTDIWFARVARISEQIRARFRNVFTHLTDGSIDEASPRIADGELVVRLASAIDANATLRALGDGQDAAAFAVPLTYASKPKLVRVEGPKEQIELGDGETELVWMVRSERGAMPPELEIRLDYDRERLLIRDRQGRDVGRRTRMRVSDHPSREEYAIRLTLEPRVQDGSEVALTFSAEGIARGVLTNLRLPAPEEIEVWISARRGTIEGSVGEPVGDSEEGRRPHRVVFDQEGRARSRLRPHPRGVTEYVISAHHRAGEAWRVQWKLDVILASAPRPDCGSRPAAEKRRIVETELVVPAGAQVALPFFARAEAAESEAAGSEAAESEAEEAGQADSAAPTGPDTSAAEDSATDVADAPDLAAEISDVAGFLGRLKGPGGISQQWVFEVVPQHPEAYLEPIVTYDDRGELIRIELRAPEPGILPPGPSTVEWEFSDEQRDAWGRHVAFRDVRRSSRQDLSQGAALTLEARARPCPETHLPVVLTVDSYPRAFEYRLPLRTGRAERALHSRFGLRSDILAWDSSTGAPRKESGGRFQVLSEDGRAFNKLERVFAWIRADFPGPGLTDDSNHLEVFLGDPEGAESRLGEHVRLDRDRRFLVDLIPRDGEQGGFALRASVHDWMVQLDPAAYRDQRIRLHSRIVATPGDRVGSPRIVDQSERFLVWDTLPPRIDREQTQLSREVVQGKPLRIVVREDVSGVERLRYSHQIDDQGELVNPETVRNAVGRESRSLEIPTANFAAGEQTLYVVLFDRAGNSSSRYDFPLTVRLPPAAATEVAKRNTLEGVVFFFRPVAGMQVQLEGPVSRQGTTDRQGRFTFRDLPPGEYRVRARGRFDSSREGEREVSVSVPAPPKDPPMVRIDFR